VVDAVRAAGFGLRELKLDKQSLEDVFVRSVEPQGGAHQ
jgi:hypothetical protein